MNESDLLKRIKDQRKNLGLSQKEMARRIDVSPSTYSKFESGLIQITMERTLQILDELNISFSISLPDNPLDLQNSIMLNRINELLLANQKILINILEELEIDV